MTGIFTGHLYAELETKHKRIEFDTSGCPSLRASSTRSNWTLKGHVFETEFGVWPARLTPLDRSPGIKQWRYSHEGIILRPGQCQCRSPATWHTLRPTSFGHRSHTGCDGASSKLTELRIFTREVRFQPGVGVLRTAAAYGAPGIKLLIRNRALPAKNFKTKSQRASATHCDVYLCAVSTNMST